MVLSSHHLAWKHALWNLLERPVATCEDLSAELYILDKCSEVALSLREFLSVVLHDLLTLEHVLEHSLDFVDGIMAALNLQLVDHQLFSLG